MKRFRYLPDVSTLELDQSSCTGCTRCLEVCPHQVFGISEKVAIIDDFDACMECGACVRNCPSGAIRVDAGVGCATGLINEWLMRWRIRDRGGECCS